MKKKARNDLVGVVIGLLMVIIGVAIFNSNATISSAFLESGDNWTWWSILIVLLPLICGIGMLYTKPDFLLSKIIAVVGAVIVIVVILVNTTIQIQKSISAIEWIISGLLVLGGFGIVVSSLFMNRIKPD